VWGRGRSPGRGGGPSDDVLDDEEPRAAPVPPRGLGPDDPEACTPPVPIEESGIPSGAGVWAGSVRRAGALGIHEGVGVGPGLARDKKASGCGSGKWLNSVQATSFWLEPALSLFLTARRGS